MKMVAIKDFEMPYSCASCDLKYCKGWNEFHCEFTCEELDLHSNERHKDCPLVEVEDGNVD